MRKTTSLLLVSSLVLASCGMVRDSRINPVNWFGKSRAVSAPVAENDNPLIPKRGGLFSRDRSAENVYLGEPVDQISDLTIERVPGGAIIRATGIAARQGAYSVRLTPEMPDETAVDGVLAYRLEALFPEDSTAAGTTATREITAARKVTDQDLRGVSSIRVAGARNARAARR